jgi:hypothetical protein
MLAKCMVGQWHEWAYRSDRNTCHEGVNQEAARESLEDRGNQGNPENLEDQDVDQKNKLKF